VVSSPLILGLDLRDQPTVDKYWDIITNREVIAVSQTWVGDNGGIVAEAEAQVVLPYCGWSQEPCQQSAWQVWAKAQPNHSTAVVLMNVEPRPQTLNVSFAAALARHTLAEHQDGDVTEPGLVAGAAIKCFVRDLWAKAELGEFVGGYTTEMVPSHDSACILVHSCTSV
jgi:hypothetical protein